MSELARIDYAKREVALLESPEDAKDLYDKLETLSQYAKRYRVDQDKQNEIAATKLRTARKGGQLLSETVWRGGDPKSREGTLPEGISRNMSSRWQLLAKLPEDELERYIDATTRSREEITLKRILRIAREYIAYAEVEDPEPASGGEVDIRHCSIADLEVERDTAALVFTDPPYPGEFLPLWETLAEKARQWLTPGRLLVAYSGQYHLPEVMYALSLELDYVWMGAVVTPGAHNQVQRKRVRSAAKPLLFYACEDYELGPWFEDAFISERRAKENHDWEQSIGAARYYIKTLTKPGELVVDPFLGSGTTAVAAQELGRRFIGCDVDPKAIATTKARLAA